MSVLVGRPAPDFTAAAVMGDGSIRENFKLSDYTGKKYVALFFWPLDFTFVCPSEIIAHEKRRKAFEDRGVQLIGVSIDSQFTHYAWRQTPVAKGGIGEVGFPMVADVTHAITQAYGIEHPVDGVAFRGTFLIDKDGLVIWSLVKEGRRTEMVPDSLEALDDRL